MYQDEIVVFLYNKFNILLNVSAVSRALASISQTKKATRQIAKERNTNLRDYYLNNLSNFKLHYLVYVDELGCDKRVGFRRTRQSLLRVTPAQVAHFYCNYRYQILPAYIQEGVLFYYMFQGTTNSAILEDFIKQLLKHCGHWLGPRSVLIIDNALIYYSEQIKEMCLNAGVKLVFLLLYSLDLNLIKEFFLDLKRFIKKNQQAYKDNSNQDFKAFLE